VDFVILYRNWLKSSLSKIAFIAALEIPFRKEYRSDLFAFSSHREEKYRFASVEPSAATFHRTVAFIPSNLTSAYQKRHTPDGVCLFELISNLKITFHPSFQGENG
jgi:hypothetical protein